LISQQLKTADTIVTSASELNFEFVKNLDNFTVILHFNTFGVYASFLMINLVCIKQMITGSCSF